MATVHIPRCPVCRAQFRRQQTCPRCGADLAVLMHLAGRSFLARRAARAALREGNLHEAGELARQAQKLCGTDSGRSLATFTDWMDHVLKRLGTLQRNGPAEAPTTAIHSGLTT